MSWATSFTGIFVGWLGFTLLLGSPGLCQADSLPIEAFYGSYEGQADATSADGGVTRGISLSIGPAEGGFNVTWSTEKWSAQKIHVKKTYSIDFEVADRPALFRSMMRRDRFGNRVPRDPLKGEPYVWGRIVDRTFTVYALLITGDGGYEMQVYHRTLGEGGINLEFSRFREGEAVRTLHAWCPRINP